MSESIKNAIAPLSLCHVSFFGGTFFTILRTCKGNIKHAFECAMRAFICEQFIQKNVTHILCTIYKMDRSIQTRVDDQYL